MKVYNILSIMLLCIILIGTVSAFEFDNVKRYDQINREVTIKNSFGLGADIGKAKLITPDVYYVPQGYQKVAEFEIEGLVDYDDAIKQIEFYNIRGGLQKTTREFDYKIKSYENVEVLEYKDTCSPDQKIAVKGECSQVIVGSHTETREVWTDLSSKDLKSGEKITIGIFTDVLPNDRVEWIPELFGVKVNEWAVWTETLNVGIRSYYRFNETSGTNIIDAVAGKNGTSTNIGFTSGILNGAYSYNGASSVSSIPGRITSPTGEWSYNYWIKANTLSASRPFNVRNDSVTIMAINENFPGQNEIELFAGGGWRNTDVVMDTGFFHMITLTYNSTGQFSLYKDGVLGFYYSGTPGAADDTNNQLGSTGSSLYFNGTIDEYGTWNRTLSASEVTDLYNGGLGLGYTTDIPPVVTLNSPTDNTAYLTTEQLVSFNCSATDGSEVTNATLWIDGVQNYTLNGDSSGFLELTHDVTLGEGLYDWTCSAYNDISLIGYAPSNYTLIIDGTSPVVNITSPADNTEYITTTGSQDVTFNISVQDVALDSCHYTIDGGSTNTTVTCGNNVTLGLSPGTTEFIFYANDTVGNVGFDGVDVIVNNVNASLEYKSSVIEGNENAVYLNITATSISTINAVLNYNGTEFNMSQIINNGTVARFNATVTAPTVSTDTFISLHANYTLNGVTAGTSNESQLIYDIPDLIVQTSACSPAALKFDLQDEQNFTVLNGTFDYNFAYGSSTNNTASKKFGQLEGSEFYVCINETISDSWDLGEGEVFYRSPNYVERRYYLFEGTTLNNETQNITLYDLLSSEQTSFKLEVEDTSLNPYVEKFTALLRWYPNLDEYLIVEMGQTDEKGDTVIHTQTEDVDYRIAVYERNGSIIKIEDPTRMICLVNPCTYTLRISPSDQDYTSVFDVDYTFTYNQTTGIWSFIYSDSSQQTSEMNLTVYKVTGTQVYSVCSDVASGFTGVLSCDTSLYSGTLRGQVVRSASPGVPLAQKVISTSQTAFSSTFGLFLSLLIALPVIFIFAVVSPIAAILGGILALIPALYFGAINWAIIGGIAVLGGIVAHFLKRVG